MILPSTLGMLKPGWIWVADLFIISRYPNTNALCVKRGGEWRTTTYKEYYQQVRTMAKAFIKLGLEPYHGVCILGFNSPEWFIGDLAAIFAGYVYYLKKCFSTMFSIIILSYTHVFCCVV